MGQFCPKYAQTVYKMWMQPLGLKNETSVP